MRSLINLRQVFTKSCLPLLLLMVFPAIPSDAQEQPSVTEKSAFQFGLEDGTPVKLKLLRDLSSGKNKTGEAVEFEVIEEVKVGEVIVIRSGAKATGTIIEAHPARRMGRTGKLSVRIDAVELVSGEKVPLRAVRHSPNGSHAKQVAANVAISGLLFFPAAPLFLLKKGEDISVPKNTLVTSFIHGDRPLEAAKFAPRN